MFSVLDKHLLTDMGKTIVRKYVHTTDAQSVWKDIQEHMNSHPKEILKREDLLNMSQKQLWMTTIKVQQNNLYFISMSSSDNLKKTTNQIAITPKCCHEFQSITTGYGRSSSLKYQTYYDLLINVCVRYDRTKKANVAKRGHIYQTTFTTHNDDFIGQFPSETPVSDPYMCIDIPSDEFYNININQSGPPISARHKLQPRLLRSNPNTKPKPFPKKPARHKWTGPIYLPGHIYKLLSQEEKDGLL